VEKVVEAEGGGEKSDRADKSVGCHAESVENCICICLWHTYAPRIHRTLTQAHPLSLSLSLSVSHTH